MTTVARINSLAAVLERFRSGHCRRRPLTTADVLGAFRRRDKRRAYFAVRHREELATDLIHTKVGLTVMQARDQVMRARHVRATPGIAVRSGAFSPPAQTLRAGSPPYARASNRLPRAQSPAAGGFAAGRTESP
jgi:hypothetical protein